MAKAKYTTRARRSADTGPNQLVVEVQILRDGEVAAQFRATFAAQLDDAVIQAEIEKRVQEFVRVDTNTIAKREVDQRAQALAEALTDREFGP